MAHPEEPQRAMTPAAESAVATPTPVPGVALAASPRVRTALWFFAAAFVLCTLAYLALNVPGAWFPSASSKTFSARDFALTRGTGLPEPGALVVTGVDESGTALITANSELRSSDYPLIVWNGSGFSDLAEVRFLWRSDYAPGKLNTALLRVSAGRLLPIEMAKNPAWVGKITGVALAVRGPLAAPVRISGMTAKSAGVREIASDRIGEWLTFERWSGSSINTLTGGAEVQELPLALVLTCAAILAAGAWTALAWRRRRMQALPIVVAMLFVIAWFALDALWTLNLARQVAETRAQFGGKDWREQHLAADDGALFGFIERVRAKLPAPPARVFIVADSTYFRGRGAYHLYPHNVFFDPSNNTLPLATSLHPGDFLVVYQRRGLQYNAEEKRLRWDGSPAIAAEALLVEPGAALFKIL
ncbi:MAG: hypothetical protein ABI777_11750 [Betaproteobacteria bacterium]